MSLEAFAAQAMNLMSSGARHGVVNSLLVSTLLIARTRSVAVDLWFCNGQSANGPLGIVREPNTVHPISRLQFPSSDDIRLLVGPHDGAVDRARHVVALHRQRDVLSHR